MRAGAHITLTYHCSGEPVSTNRYKPDYLYVMILPEEVILGLDIGCFHMMILLEEVRVALSPHTHDTHDESLR